MSLYEYAGQLTTGAAITGEFEAASPDDARQALAATNVHITQLAATPAMRPVRPLSHDDVMFFNEQLASMAKSGIALDIGLRLLAQDLRRGRLKTVIQHLASELERGVPIERALAAQKGQFPPLYADVLRAGAQSQQLGETLLNLSAHLKLMDAGRRLFRESAAYPLVVLVLGFGVMTFFMTVVVPGLGDIYAEFAEPSILWRNWSDPDPFDTSLPWLTRAMLRLSFHWYSISLGVIGVVLFFFLSYWLSGLTQGGLYSREVLLSKMPGIGSIRRNSLMARFANAAALGAKAGQDFPTILRAAAGATGSGLLQSDAEALAARVEKGATPLEAALPARFIPPIFGYTVAVAGARGQLASALAEMAHVYDQLARHRLQMTKMILMPLMILMTAAIIGLCVIALLIPLVTLLNNLTGG